MGTLPSHPEPIFFSGLDLASTVPYFISKYKFTVFCNTLDNDIIVAMQYLKTMIIFKNFCEKKTFNQTVRFVFEKLLKKWGSIVSGSFHRGPN